MEQQHISLHLESLQTQAGETSRVEQDLDGTLTLLEQGWAVSYREPADSGLGESVTTLTAAPGKVILDRKGETACRMVFREGRRTVGDYASPYGRFDLDVFTRKASAVLEAGKGRIELCYDLSLAGGEPGETQMTLTFTREKTEKGK